MYFVSIMLLVVSSIFAMYAQFKVKHTFAAYKNIGVKNSVTGAMAARKVLEANGLSGIDAIKKKLKDELGIEGTPIEVISYAMYPKVFEDYINTLKKQGSLKLMGSDVFFHGIKVGETCEVKISEGKELVIKLVEIREPQAGGIRDVVFEVNGNRRTVQIKDNDVEDSVSTAVTVMADEDNPLEIGANIPGKIIKVLAKVGDKITESDPIAIVEAMKMESKIIATANGVVDEIFIKEGQQVKAGEMVAILSEE